MPNKTVQAIESQIERFPVPASQLKTNLEFLLRAAGELQAETLVHDADLEVSLYDFDNWNGGTYGWALVLRISMETFAALTPARKETAEKTLANHASRLLDEFENDTISQVRIAPKLIPAQPSSSSALVLPPLETGYAAREGFCQARELELVHEIASGAFGSVYLARHRRLTTNVAIKFFSPHPLVVDSTERRDKAKERLLREGQLLATIRHENVVRLLDCSLIAGEPVLVLEFVEGASLRELREREGPLEANSASKVLRQILSALAECHARGVVHRDVSPRNVIVQPSGRAVLIDFGLGFSAEFVEKPRLTTQPIGTPGFSAPELDQDPLIALPSVDVFGAGAVGAYLLTGRAPQLGTPLQCAGAPPALIAVLQRALELDPRRRFVSAREMLDALDALNRVASTANPEPAVGAIIDEDECRDFLGLERGIAVKSTTAELLHRFAVAVSRIASTPGDPAPMLALLLSAAHHELGHVCETDDLLASLGRLLAALSGAVEIKPRAFLVATLEKATERGWLQKGEYDAWRPGMRSGSGMRETTQPTSIGARWLERNAGFVPAK